MLERIQEQYWESELARSIQTQEYALFAQLRPLLIQDGNQWCVLYGKDLHDGIAGFGNTPYLAILAFNAEWYKPAQVAPQKEIDLRLEGTRQ